MSDNSDDPKVELHVYEELVGDVNWNSPVRIQTSSMVPVASALTKGTAFHPSRSHNNNWRSVEATDFLFAHAPRPDPRDHDELSEAPREVPR